MYDSSSFIILYVKIISTIVFIASISFSYCLLLLGIIVVERVFYFLLLISYSLLQFKVNSQKIHIVIMCFVIDIDCYYCY